ncbi:proteasome assembly chaperone 4 isoform X1 [Brachyhypopomus gauderio]|uniref:proteasome assembly chaperone 4 isoform X1 n=1 Tax=Brachyhypopomus gauderio TaxID=698409 RepID=UPI00404218B4
MERSGSPAPVHHITVHDFSEKILEQLVHFHVMKLDGGFFLWVGASAVLGNMALSMSSARESLPLCTLVLGDSSETTPSSLAQRLSTQHTDRLYCTYFLTCIRFLNVLIKCSANLCLSSLAAKKTDKQVFVSYNLPTTDSNLTLLVENRIKKEMELHPDKF